MFLRTFSPSQVYCVGNGPNMVKVKKQQHKSLKSFKASLSDINTNNREKEGKLQRHTTQTTNIVLPSFSLLFNFFVSQRYLQTQMKYSTVSCAHKQNMCPKHTLK